MIRLTIEHHPTTTSTAFLVLRLNGSDVPRFFLQFSKRCFFCRLTLIDEACWYLNRDFTQRWTELLLKNELGACGGWNNG